MYVFLLLFIMNLMLYTPAPCRIYQTINASIDIRMTHFWSFRQNLNSKSIFFTFSGWVGSKWANWFLTCGHRKTIFFLRYFSVNQKVKEIAYEWACWFVAPLGFPLVEICEASDETLFRKDLVTEERCMIMRSEGHLADKYSSDLPSE